VTSENNISSLTLTSVTSPPLPGAQHVLAGAIRFASKVNPRFDFQAKVTSAASSLCHRHRDFASRKSSSSTDEQKHAHNGINEYDVNESDSASSADDTESAKGVCQLWRHKVWEAVCRVKFCFNRQVGAPVTKNERYACCVIMPYCVSVITSRIALRLITRASCLLSVFFLCHNKHVNIAMIIANRVLR